jgi:O-antigen/teichoic acid export membrane protein
MLKCNQIEIPTMTQEQAVLEKPNSPASPPSQAEISKRSLAKSVFSNWAYLFLNVLVAFWMTPFVVRHLGDSAYGIWALVLQLTGYMGIVDVGLRSALVRFIARLNARKDHVALNRLLSSTLLIYGLLAPGCVAVGLFLSAYVLPHMQIGGSFLRTAQITVVIASGLIACDFLFATPHATLAALSRWDLINVTSSVVILVRTALIIIFLKLGFGLVTLATIQLATCVVSYSFEVAWIRLFHLLPEFKFVLHKPGREEMQPVVQHGWYSLLLSVANRINYQVDTIVIGVFLPVGQVTFYVIGLRLIEYLRELLNSSTMIVAPVVSSLEAVGDSRQVQTVLVRGTKYSVLIGFLGGAAFLTLGRDFIRLWMGPRFEGPSGTVLAILASGVIVSCTQFISGHILLGLSKHRINLGWTTIESVLNLALSVILVRKYGIWGVAAGTATANLLIRGWLFPRSVLKTLNVSWATYLGQGVLPPVVPAVAFVIGVWLYKRLFPIQNFGNFLLAALAGVLCFAVAGWFFTTDRLDRDLAVTKARQLGAYAGLRRVTGAAGDTLPSDNP